LHDPHTPVTPSTAVADPDQTQGTATGAPSSHLPPCLAAAGGVAVAAVGVAAAVDVVVIARWVQVSPAVVSTAAAIAEQLGVNRAALLLLVKLCRLRGERGTPLPAQPL
jgi:hypothetical protein